MFLAKDMQPYSRVESDGFKEVLKYAFSNTKIPSRKTIADRVMPEIKQDIKSNLINELQSYNKSFAITSDIWKSKHGGFFIDFTIHFLNDNFEINNFVLATKSFFFKQYKNNDKKSKKIDYFLKKSIEFQI